MDTKRIVLLPGDGVGPEVVAEAQKVLAALAQRLPVAFSYETHDIGGAAYDAQGVPLPEETLAACLAADAVFLGAVGGPAYDALPPALRPEQGLLQLRKGLGLYANLRPVCTTSGIDLMMVRELTGGLYFGQPKGRTGTGAQERAVDTMVYTRPEIERIAHLGFELAQARRGQLTSIDKANVLATSQLWRDVVNGLAPQYPDVTVAHMYVDNAAMQLIRNPQQFDVMLTENMFGDILSDEAAMLAGSLGMLPSASFGAAAHPGGPRRGLYEPAHGSAPDIAGQDKVNPIATILSLAMMLEWSFGLADAARSIEAAVSQVLAAGIRTADIAEPGGQWVGTRAMGDAIVAAVDKIPAGSKCVSNRA